jgi:hypothetical protein
MPILLTPPALEIVLQGLHESEIRCGIQNEPPAGGITVWIDFGSRTEKATFYGTIVGDRQVWPAAERIAVVDGRRRGRNPDPIPAFTSTTPKILSNLWRAPCNANEHPLRCEAASSVAAS